MNEPLQPEHRRCCRVTYEGRVQGVGFRFTTASAAKVCHVNGYVRNRADGTVELVAEGSSRNVERLLESLSQTFAGSIAGQTVEEIAQSDPLRGFEIRR
ncbi:MAG TPA: acylphosphatase [Planctomycetaceae bacterium]|jgi:acylphosphatase|nr:acylphosphatase [Planctomycetaceae bacterium]